MPLHPEIGAVLCVIAGLQAGCHVVWPFDAEEQRGADLSADGSVDDQRTDRALLDGPPLPLPLDTRPGPDAGGPAWDGAATGGCAGSPLSTQTYHAKMLGCQYAQPIDQCQASAFCKTPWHLCTAQEFLARNGKITAPAGSSAWIGACVRNGGAATSPTKAPCPTCGGTPLGSVVVRYTCTGTPVLPATAPTVGVHTYGQCQRVGENLAANEALWSAIDAKTPLPGAMCCAP